MTPLSACMGVKQPNSVKQLQHQPAHAGSTGSTNSKAAKSMLKLLCTASLA
jgi:hypothetical protein